MHKLVDHLFSNRKSPNFANTPNIKEGFLMGNLFAEAKLKTALANDTYTDKKEIVSKAGYLLGVDKNIFDSGELLSEIYEELEKNQDARMVRNLCFLFTCIEHLSNVSIQRPLSEIGCKLQIK